MHVETLGTGLKVNMYGTNGSKTDRVLNDQLPPD